MNEKTLSSLLDIEESKNLAIRKAHYTKLREDEKLTDEQKNIIDNYLYEIEQRFEHIDETNRFNNAEYIATIHVTDDVVQMLKGTLH